MITQSFQANIGAVHVTISVHGIGAGSNIRSIGVTIKNVNTEEEANAALGDDASKQLVRFLNSAMETDDG